LLTDTILKNQKKLLTIVYFTSAIKFFR
jgi:hypothetical protein